MLIGQKMLENPPKNANKSTAEAKNPPVHWLWFTFSSVGPLKLVGSHPNVWLFIHLLIGQEALAMSSEEDEAVCLTNNGMEQYNRTLKKLVGSHPNVSGSSSSG